MSSTRSSLLKRVFPFVRLTMVAIHLRLKVSEAEHTQRGWYAIGKCANRKGTAYRPRNFVGSPRIVVSLCSISFPQRNFGACCVTSSFIAQMS